MCVCVCVVVVGGKSGEKIQTSLLRTHFSLYLIPSVLIMALSGTLPPSFEFLVAHDIGLRKPYFHASQPLNCPNIFYSVKRKQSPYLF